MPKQLQDRGAPSMLVADVRAHPARFSSVMPLSLRRVPLLLAACALALGIVLSHAWRPAATLVVATMLLLSVAAVALRRAPRLAPAAVIFCWLLLGWTLGVLQPRALPDGALQPFTDGLRRDVIATVDDVHPLPLRTTARDDDPLRPQEQAQDREAQDAAQSYSVDLRVTKIERLDPELQAYAPASGLVRLTVAAQDAAALGCGEQVNATVRLYQPRTFRDPGVWQYGEWLGEQGVAAVGTVVPHHLLTKGSSRATLHCELRRAQLWASARLQSFAQFQARLPLPSAVRWSNDDTAAWTAMLAGDRSALKHNLRANFERTGTFHLFVVSGLHIGLVAAGVWWVATRFRVNSLAAAAITGAVTTLYALVAGFGAPSQRALGMTLVYLLATALSRERNTMNAIGAAALAMLVLRPQSLFDASFQMTVLIAVTIGGIAAPLLERTIAPYLRACRNLDLIRLDRRLPPRIAQFRVLLRWTKQAVAMRFGKRCSVLVPWTLRGLLALSVMAALALVTEATMALPMAFYFHRFTAFALPANLLIVPLLGPLMICGMATLCLSLIAQPLALLASVPAALLLHLTNYVVHTLGSLHGSELRTPGPVIAAAITLAGLVVAAVLLLRVRPRRVAWLGVAATFTVAAGTLLLPHRLRPSSTLGVNVIDVGQGDSILLTAPTGHAMLIDAGGTVGPEEAANENAFDVGEEVVSPYLWQRGIARLDTIALTHAHMDHLGGMSAVLRNFRPRELWLSAQPPSAHLEALLEQARSQGTTVRILRAGATTVWEGIDIHVLAPAQSYVSGDTPANDDSLVLRLEYGHASALLAGDAEAPSEEAMLASGIPGPVTLLKVGHHGSLTSTTEDFLAALSPRMAAISCGRGNHFGHPRMQILTRLQSQAVQTSRTDTMGALQYDLHADGSAQVDVPSR